MPGPYVDLMEDEQKYAIEMLHKSGNWIEVCIRTGYDQAMATVTNLSGKMMLGNVETYAEGEWRFKDFSAVRKIKIAD